MSNMEEIWKPLYYDFDKYVEYYQISNTGRIWTTLKHMNQEVKTRINGGYVIFNARIEGKRKTIKLHRALGFAFIPNDDPENKNQINHKNCIKIDNNLDNLEWCTASENQKHAVENNLTKKKFGCDHWNNKLNEEQVLTILTLSPYMSNRDLGDIYGVSDSCVRRVVVGETFTNYPRPFKKYQQHKKDILLDDLVTKPII